MDLTHLKAKTSIQHTVDHPVDGLTEWVITLASDEHPATKAALREALDRRRKRKEAFDLDADEREGLELLVARTLGWEGLVCGGVEVPFTAEAAREIYSTAGMGWLKRQLIAAMGDEARFFTK